VFSIAIAAARVMLKSRMHHFVSQRPFELCGRERVHKGRVVKKRDSVSCHGPDRVVHFRTKTEEQCSEEGMIEQ
jgi:hypothetical protein